MVEKSLLEKASKFTDAALTFVDDDGYPYSVPVKCEFDFESGLVTFQRPKGLGEFKARDAELIFNHVTPIPVGGYTDRRYVLLWGRLQADGGKLTLRVTKGFTWDEHEVPFFQYSEMKTAKARSYLNELTQKPWISTPWLIIRTFRLPFLIATVLPITLGALIAYRSGFFNWILFALTMAGALLMHLGVNTANDYFDGRAGVDELNTTPTPFSGGSRIIQYGLLPANTVLSLSTASYAGGILIGLYLTFTRGLPVLLIGLVGLLVSYGYTAPPLKWSYRGIGELAVFVGFGPVLVLGSYFVQAQSLSFEAFLASIVPGMLIMLILYVNEVSDRTWDDEAGKKTLVARMHEGSIIMGFVYSMAIVYGTIVVGTVARIFPVSSLIALLSIPLALKVRGLIKKNFGNPYALIPAMSSNIKLYTVTTALLIVGYAVALLLRF